MAIDKIELAAEIEKNPEIVAAATEALSKKGFVIRDKAADTTFMDNYKKDVIEKDFPAKFSDLNNKYDADIESITGLKKEPTEKTHEYLKRATAAKIGEFSTKITEYEKTIREKGDPSGILKKQVEDAQEAARQAIAERDKTVKDMTAKNEFVTRQSAVNSAYAEISKSFRKDLPPMWDRLKNGVLEDVIKVTVSQDGVLYIGDGNGGTKKDASFNPITIADHLKAEFKDVIDTKREQNGSGSGKGGGRQNDDSVDPKTITKENFIMPASVKTQDDLMGYLIAAGIPRGPVFNDIYDKFGKGVDRVVEAGKVTRKKVSEGLPPR